MSEGDLLGTGKGPPHLGHHRALSKATEERLAALGERIPPMSEEEIKSIARERTARIVRHMAVLAVVLVVMLAVVLAGAQWLRPLPPPAFRAAVSAPLLLPGTLPSLPQPATGSAALSVEGDGSLGRFRSTRPAPIAGIATVLTAYVILKDHPLALGDAGPTMPVTQATIAAYQAGVATQQSEAPVALGESLTELQALEGMLVASDDDMATLLADWDAGSSAEFVAKMNRTTQALGLNSTHITDPSGFDSGTVSTPADLIRLGEAAMAIPTFRQIVALGQVTLPGAGLVYNLDYDLGQDGIIGLKTGSDSAANGCFLFAAQKTVAGKNVTLIGAVLGQEGTSPNTAAVSEADLLVKAAFASIALLPLFPAGHVVGQLVTPWGASAPVLASTSPYVVGWPGLGLHAKVRLVALPSPVHSGTRVGVLRVDQSGHVTGVVLRTSRPLSGPSALWRLIRM
jgi:D-alanyl-D-alanine carboxypeptidase (penicillin-binding protein 5/6)